MKTHPLTPDSRVPCIIFLSLLIGWAVSWTSASKAQLTYSPDVTVSLAGTVVADEDAAEDDLLGSVELADLGSLPGRV